MSAKDQQTNASQQVTIEESTNLDASEVERMINESQQHAAEDRRRREEIDARNQLDSMAYRVEQLVTELQDSLPVHEKARAEQLVQDARAAVAEGAGLDRVRPLIADLEQLAHGLPASAAAASGTGTGGGDAGAASGAAGSGETADDEEVVDAEFTRE
ncbi:MAG: chaperone protein DnaK [Solirubrobacterales bacterium]|nr:chaperone protein DnaK [Solirubrobacterales bacterium]